MALETPHLQWPFQLDRAGSTIQFVEQDDDVEIEQCVAFVVSTEQGTLVGSPQLGMPDPTFKPGGVSEGALASLIARWEPRASIVFTSDELVKFIQNIGIEVT